MRQNLVIEEPYTDPSESQREISTNYGAAETEEEEVEQPETKVRGAAQLGTLLTKLADSRRPTRNLPDPHRQQRT